MMIKKGLVIISTVGLILMLTTMPLFARAGGGSSGGSSGGSGGSSGGSSAHHSHGRNTNSQYSEKTGVTRLLVYGSVATVMVGCGMYFRQAKARKMHRLAKKQLAILDDNDDFWNEKRIKKEVENCYYAIQQAWSNQDIETLKKYLTPSLLETWQTKLVWQQYQGQRNVLEKVRLLGQGVVEVYDSENDDEDYFWVYLEGKMDDRIIDEKNRIIEQNTDVFVEYWKFQRNGNNIYLDKIYQQDEFES